MVTYKICKCYKSVKNAETVSQQFTDRSESIYPFLSKHCEGTRNAYHVPEVQCRSILPYLQKHLLSNKNPHSRFSPIYQPTEPSTLPHTLAMSSTDAVDCGSGGGDDTSFGLRIASVFIILVGSMAGALFPVLAKRSTWLHVPKPIFEFVLKSFIILVFLYSCCINIQLRQILRFRSHCTVHVFLGLRNSFLRNFFFFRRSPQHLSIFSHLEYPNSQVHVCLQIGPYMYGHLVI